MRGAVDERGSEGGLRLENRLPELKDLEKRTRLNTQGRILMQFLRDHIIEALISIIVGLLAFIGRSQITTLERDMRNLQCSVATFSLDKEFDQVEFELIRGPLDTIKADSRQIQDVLRLNERFGHHLKDCDSGKKLLSNIESLHQGLLAYVNKDYGKAIGRFDSMDQGHSLTHKLLGAAKFHKSESSPPEEAKRLQDQSAQHFDTARLLAAKELGGSEKEAAIINLACNRFVVQTAEEANQAAITCLLEIAEKGKATYVTYYNLAAKSSRMGRLGDTLKYMRKCIDLGGTRNFSRAQIGDDPAFHDFILKSERSGEFRVLLNKFPL